MFKFTKEQYEKMLLLYGSLLYKNKCILTTKNEGTNVIVSVVEGIDIAFYEDVYLPFIRQEEKNICV